MHTRLRSLLPFLLLAFIIIFSATRMNRQVAQAAASDLFISEYVEGSANNKAIEIYNGTGGAIDLAAGGYTLEFYFNGNTSPLTTITLAGTIADGAVHVVVDNDATASLINLANQISNSSFFNGDDAILLRKNGTIIDSIGQLGVDPGSQWGSGAASTQNNTLRRLDAVCEGDGNAADAFDPAAEWSGLPQDTFDGLGSHTANCGPAVDTPPEVATTDPAASAINVAVNANITISFDEPVTVSGSWNDIACTSSGSHTAAVSGGPQSYTLNPDVDFVEGESCTVTVFAAGVADQDPPADSMTADYIFSFDTVFSGNGCGDPATAVHTVQGNGAQSPLVSSVVTVEGVVIGDYQATVGELGGFFIQEEDGDADGHAATSEGIFVFDSGFGTDVAAGDVVRVTGTVSERETNPGSGAFLTEITSLTALTLCGSGAAVTPATVSLPVSDLADWEAYEGMLVHLPQTLTVSENYTLGRYGEVSLSLGRLYNPTNITTPGAAAAAQQNLNDRSRIILDDHNAQQNVDPTLHPAPGLSAANTLRSGYTVNGITAVVDQRFSAYRLQPIGAVSFDATANPRTVAPSAVGGSLRVASFNVLNYFNGNGSGGGFPTPRGADTAAEFTRQRDKIISAIVSMDADIVGLMEIENDGYGGNSAIQDLVNALNDATAPGTYAFIDPGVGQIGSDQIAVGILYRPSAVSPIGASAILDSGVDSTFLDTKNRPVLAQTFAESGTGEKLTVAVNHLKSKGSACTDVGDPDAGDGQGNCNGVRTDAATALVNWLATDPTGSGDPDFMIMGDLNAYAMEDPITAIENGGYTNLIAQFEGAAAYSYVFDGQAGYLDHALATASLTAQVTGVTEWHINADEPIVLDYNTEFKTANQVNTFYSPNAFRASDHDPVIIGLTLGGSATPTPSPIPTNTPMPTATPTNTPPPTVTPQPTATNTPPPTATSTAQPTATATPTATSTTPPTATATPQPTATQTPTPMATNTPPPSPTPTSAAASFLHVADLDGVSTNEGKRWTATVTVRVADDTGAAVANTLVSGSWSLGGGSSCTTDGSGTCSLSYSGIRKKTGSITFTVTGLSGPLPYAPAANGDPDGDSDGTTIVVYK